jgi:DNA invertase Pin-like site-specific DNA recombinase
MNHGYARVSTDGWSLFNTGGAVHQAGCEKILGEVARGAKTDRAQLKFVLSQLEAGGVFMVTRLDSLARSTRDLLNALGTITYRQVSSRSLRDPWADTTTSHGRLMLTVLGGLAELKGHSSIL